jgi:D-3-phosphoglycerate dehydrogenase
VNNSVHNVLITGTLHASAIASFKSNKNLNVVYLPDCDRKTLLSHLKESSVLVTRSETDVDSQVIDAAPQLKVIARAAVGVGNIDIQYATDRGILVINCPGKNTNSAAELTLALLLGMLRNVPQAHDKVKRGGWDRHTFSGRELRGKTIGLIGLGNVGHRVAKFALGFDMNVLAFDPYISPAVFESNGVKRVTSLKDLVAQVDVLSFHVPLNKETKGMLTLPLMQSMRPGSWIVNAARGGVYKESELVPLLRSGHIAGLAVDTFESEPKPLADLLSLPNVWVTPHIGASTEEAQIAIGETIYDQVVKAVGGGVVDYPVNLPQVGIITDQKVRAYAVLAEKLGALAAQMIAFNPMSIELLYRGDLAGLDHQLIRLSFMKGYAARIVNEYVSFVNVEAQVERLGIHVVGREEPSFDSYRSALKVRMSGADGAELKVGGIVFDDFIPRLSLVNDFYFETEPSGHLVFVENDDKPGVIGDLGHFMATRGINIATFELSRNRRGGRAMAVIRTDDELATPYVSEMLGIKNVLAVHRVSL